MSVGIQSIIQVYFLRVPYCDHEQTSLNINVTSDERLENMYNDTSNQLHTELEKLVRKIY